MPVFSRAGHVPNLGALEQGLGVHSTKLGPDNKEEAYAMTKARVRWFLAGIIAALVLLSILVGIYAGLFNDERIRRVFQEKQTMERIGEEKVDAVRLGIAIHQQEAEREHQEYDTKRAMKRIMSVVGRKFDELISAAKEPNQILKLKESKAHITTFVNDELKDFEKEKRAYDVQAKKRLEKLAVAQEQSLRELLKSVSGVKMEAMEDMLEEVFAAGKRAPLLEVSDQAVDEIEELADALYEGKTDLQKGRQRLETIRLQIGGTLPDDLTKAFSDARDGDAFAQALDELVEITKLARGKKEIEAIEASWRKDVDKARDKAESSDQPQDEEDEDIYDEEIKLNVDALLAIQKLVAEGKVPVYLLDFEAIDMKDLQPSGDDQDEEQDQEDGGEDVQESPPQDVEEDQQQENDQEGGEQQGDEQQQEGEGQQEEEQGEQQQENR
jgi:hypothetical protein